MTAGKGRSSNSASSTTESIRARSLSKSSSSELSQRKKKRKSKIVKKTWESWVDILAVILTVALSLAPVYAAWDYGGINAWSQWLLSNWLGIVTVLALPVIWIRYRFGRKRFFAPLLCVLAIWLIGFAQTVSIPEWLTNLASPGSASAYADWIPEVLRAEAAGSDVAVLSQTASNWRSASIDAGLTRHYLTMPALFFATMLVSAFLIRSKQTIVVYLLITMVAGGFFAFTGMADAIRPTDPGLQVSEDLITPSEAGAPFGPFVNRNNAAGYLNLSLAACVGLLVYVVQIRREKMVVDQRYAVTAEQWWQRPIFAIQAQVRELDASAVAVLLVIILIIAGIAVSGSRGGFLGVIAGTIAATILTAQRGAGLGKSLGVVVVAVGTMGLLGFIGMFSTVSERLDTIWSSGSDRDGRLDHWLDGLSAAWHYFPGGSGLGTYRYAYLPFQESSAGAWFVNADGMHVEWLVEGGLWLFPILMVLALLVMMELSALSKLKRAPHVTSLIACGWFGLAAMMVSQSFDFGITLPAAYLSLAMMLGAIIGTSDRFSNQLEKTKLTLGDVLVPEVGGTPNASSEQVADAEEPASKRPLLKLASPANLLSEKKSSLAWTGKFMLAFCCIAVCGMLWHSVGESYQAALGAQPYVDAGNPPVVTASLSAHEHLQIVSELIESQSIITSVPSDLPEGITPDFYRQAATVPGRRAAYFLTARPAGESPDSVMLPGQSFPALVSARDHALAAILKSPLSAEARFRLAQLDFVNPETVEASGLLLTQFGQLRRRNPSVLISAARVALVNPGAMEAGALLKSALTLAPEATRTVWPIVSASDNLDYVLAALPENPTVHVNILESVPGLKSQWRTAILEQALTLVNATRSSQRTIEQHVTAGRLAMQVRDWSAAASSFEIAVDKAPATTEYRYLWAMALVEIGDFEQAFKQIQRCVLQEPKSLVYQGKEREIQKMVRTRTR